MQTADQNADDVTCTCGAAALVTRISYDIERGVVLRADVIVVAELRANAPLSFFM